MATIKLIDEQVDEISVIDSNNKYKNGQRAKDGKTFSRYRYNGIVFTVDTDNPFNQAFTEGNVDSVKLIEGTREVVSVDSNGEEQTSTVNTLQFDSFVSFAQTERRAEHKAKIKRYEVIASTPISSELLKELVP